MREKATEPALVQELEVKNCLTCLPKMQATVIVIGSHVC